MWPPDRELIYHQWKWELNQWQPRAPRRERLGEARWLELQAFSRLWLNNPVAQEQSQDW